MNYSLIDIGSNSIRLTVYDINGTDFKSLFHSKIMAGLAGYVENQILSEEGIDAAKSALLEFQKILEALSVKHRSVFATASLRNIANTKDVVNILSNTTGFHIDIIDGKEEALLSYAGAKLEFPEISEGAFADIGGASTEIISFVNNVPTHISSLRLGSLNLYKKYEGKIFPGKQSLKRIHKTINHELKKVSDFSPSAHAPFICVGGTARAIMKIARNFYHLPANCNTLTLQQADDIFLLLTTDKSKAVRLILRTSPDRIHTIVPGFSILISLLHLYHSDKIIVSNYGIREGFLCKKIIQSNKITTPLLKTEN